MLLDLCTDSEILMITKIIKNNFTWVQIIGPILALIVLCIHISKIVTTNDISNIRKYNKNIINTLIALALLFLLPSFVNLTMSIIGEKTTLSSCWNSIDIISLKSSGKYIEKKDNKKRTRVYNDTSKYHGKTTKSTSTVTNTTTNSGEKNI